MTDTQQRVAAKAFAKNWKDRGYEKGDSQIFWVELLTTVFGVTEISQFISFEDQVHLDHTSFIDGYIEKTHVMIEQKSINKSLTAAIRQSDGSMLTPFEQAKRYSSELPYSKRPRWIVTSNFQSFYIYDMEKPGGDPEIIQLENLEKEYYRLQFLVDEGNTNLQREMEVSIAAGEIVGLLYDALAKQYVDPTTERAMKSLNIRRLENEVIKELQRGQITFGFDESSPIHVSIDQFYGIEINDFAVTVAKTALWIAESQMMKETEDIVHMNLDFLPLTTNAFIVEGNSLQIDWESVVPKYQVSYIMGNPPFVGARVMSSEQKDDVKEIFQGWKNVGNMDYVCCWYKKCADFMKNTSIRAALVSTNSVSQGESVANLWKPLLENDVHIDFAYRTFQWDSEAKIKAHVHCVIIGFSIAPYNKPKKIFIDERYQIAKNINGYLLDAANVYVESRNKPICNIPEIGIGNKPIDGGYYLFEKEEMEEFIKKEPEAKKYFRPWYGSKEFINRSPRYCLWLGECSPAELRKLPLCMERVREVKEYRLQSTSAGTVKLAERPTRFHVENMPKGQYIVIPEVSSQRRRYVPMGFFTPNIFCSNLVKIIPDATLYHFGVLTSNVHMAWMRVVCGRLKSDYRYSKDIVYNNFPWPEPSTQQRQKIEQTAQAILDARALYPDSSLADLYDELTMPLELRKAHHQNDMAVMQAYGFTKGSEAYKSEAACVAELMQRYQKLCEEQK